VVEKGVPYLECIRSHKDFGYASQVFCEMDEVAAGIFTRWLLDYDEVSNE